MKIVSIDGGLGNQMLKYAFALALQYYHPNETIRIDSRMCRYRGAHNGYELDTLFDLKLKEASWFDIYRVSKRASLAFLYRFNKQWYERSVSRFYDKKDPFYFENYNSTTVFDSTLLFHEGSAYYDIYPKSWRYFADLREIVSKSFELKQVDNTEFYNQKDELSNQNSIGIHIRGGDYLTTENQIYQVCTPSYYLSALKLARTKCPEGPIYVFTNDLLYFNKIRNQFLGSDNVIVLTNQGKYSYRDIFLMSCCKVLVLANSSFSWWGGWLNSRTDNLIIAPRKWSQVNGDHDYCLPEWILL